LVVAGEGGEVEAELSGEDACPPVATDAKDEEDEGKDTGDFTVEDAEAQTGMPGVQSLRTLPTATGEARAKADAIDEQDDDGDGDGEGNGDGEEEAMLREMLRRRQGINSLPAAGLDEGMSHEQTRVERLLAEATAQLHDEDEDEDVESAARRRHTCKQLLLQVRRNATPCEDSAAPSALLHSAWGDEEEAETRLEEQQLAALRHDIERRDEERARGLPAPADMPPAASSAALPAETPRSALLASPPAAAPPASDPHAVLNVCARQWPVATLAAGPSGAAVPSITQTAEPSAGPRDTRRESIATVGADVAASALLEPTCTQQAAPTTETPKCLGSTAAAAAAIEAAAASARPRGRQSAAQLQRRLQAALSMHMTIVQTERELSVLQTSSSAQRASELVALTELRGGGTSGSVTEQAAARRRHEEIVALQGRLAHEQRLAAERFATLEQRLDVVDLSRPATLHSSTAPANADAQLRSCAPAPHGCGKPGSSIAPAAAGAPVKAADAGSARPAAAACATATTAPRVAAVSAGAQQALDCLEYTLRMASSSTAGLCSAASAEEQAALGGPSGAAEARCVGQSPSTEPLAAGVTGGGLQLIVEGPAAPRQYVVEVPTGVGAGGSFVAMLGGSAMLVTVPLDRNLPPGARLVVEAPQEHAGHWLVQVPPGLPAGSTFCADVGGQLMQVKVPTQLSTAQPTLSPPVAAGAAGLGRKSGKSSRQLATRRGRSRGGLGETSDTADDSLGDLLDSSEESGGCSSEAGFCSSSQESSAALLGRGLAPRAVATDGSSVDGGVERALLALLLEERSAAASTANSAAAQLGAQVLSSISAQQQNVQGGEWRRREEEAEESARRQLAHLKKQQREQARRAKRAIVRGLQQERTRLASVYDGAAHTEARLDDATRLAQPSTPASAPTSARRERPAESAGAASPARSCAEAGASGACCEASTQPCASAADADGMAPASGVESGQIAAQDALLGTEDTSASVEADATAKRDAAAEELRGSHVESCALTAADTEESQAEYTGDFTGDYTADPGFEEDSESVVEELVADEAAAGADTSLTSAGIVEEISEVADEVGSSGEVETDFGSDDEELRGQREAMAQLREQLAARRRQAEQLLAEAHLSERMQRRREALLTEEAELLAQLGACEDLIKQGRRRLRASERATHASRSAAEISGSASAIEEMYDDGEWEMSTSVADEVRSMAEASMVESAAEVSMTRSVADDSLVQSAIEASMAQSVEEASVAEEFAQSGEGASSAAGVSEESFSAAGASGNEIAEEVRSGSEAAVLSSPALSVVSEVASAIDEEVASAIEPETGGESTLLSVSEAAITESGVSEVASLAAHAASISTPAVTPARAQPGEACCPTIGAASTASIATIAEASCVQSETGLSGTMPSIGSGPAAGASGVGPPAGVLAPRSLAESLPSCVPSCVPSCAASSVLSPAGRVASRGADSTAAASLAPAPAAAPATVAAVTGRPAAMTEAVRAPATEHSPSASEVDEVMSEIDPADDDEQGESSIAPATPSASAASPHPAGVKQLPQVAPGSPAAGASTALTESMAEQISAEQSAIDAGAAAGAAEAARTPARAQPAGEPSPSTSVKGTAAAPSTLLEPASDIEESIRMEEEREAAAAAEMAAADAAAAREVAAAATLEEERRRVEQQVLAEQAAAQRVERERQADVAVDGLLTELVAEAAAVLRDKASRPRGSPAPASAADEAAAAAAVAAAEAPPEAEAAAEERAQRVTEALLDEMLREMAAEQHARRSTPQPQTPQPAGGPSSSAPVAISRVGADPPSVPLPLPGAARSPLGSPLGVVAPPLGAPPLALAGAGKLAAAGSAPRTLPPLRGSAAEAGPPALQPQPVDKAIAAAPLLEKLLEAQRSLHAGDAPRSPLLGDAALQRVQADVGVEAEPRSEGPMRHRAAYSRLVRSLFNELVVREDAGRPSLGVAPSISAPIVQRRQAAAQREVSARMALRGIEEPAATKAAPGKGRASSDDDSTRAGEEPASVSVVAAASSARGTATASSAAATGASAATSSARFLDEGAEGRFDVFDTNDVQRLATVGLEREMRAVQVEVSDAVMARLVREVVTILQEVEGRRRA